MCGFSDWYKRQLKYWSAYQNYAKEWFSKQSNIYDYMRGVLISQYQAQQRTTQPQVFLWGKQPREERPATWFDWLYHFTEGLNYVMGATGINPLGGYVAQTLHQHESQFNVTPNPVVNILQQAYTESPQGQAQQAVSGAVNALASVGRQIQQGWQWFVSVVGKWGPIILLIIILFLIIKLVRG